MEENVKTNLIALRRARGEDAAALAELATQLGYPTTADQVQRRLADLEAHDFGAVFVAELPGRGVVGWIHVHPARLLEMEPFADLGGLVVADGSRGMGIGAALLQMAENWARGQGFAALFVRSNVIRGEAHRFYEKQGYRVEKQQKMFRKDL